MENKSANINYSQEVYYFFTKKQAVSIILSKTVFQVQVEAVDGERSHETAASCRTPGLQDKGWK